MPRKGIRIGRNAGKIARTTQFMFSDENRIQGHLKRLPTTQNQASITASATFGHSE
jgi:hypothetical protein